jgi:DNA-binding transcriptional LysR family regulator
VTDLRKIDLNLLVVLHAILEERNLTRAGERIGTSQPAVSGALARIRQQYDDPLLIRVGNKFELTPRAQALKPLVEEAMEAVTRMLDLLPAFEPASSERTFYISASDYALAELTGPLLRQLEEKAPNVRMQFDALPFDAHVDPDDLIRRDLIIAAAGRIPGKRQDLFHDRFVCIVDGKNPRLREGRLSLSDLADLRHVRSSFGKQTTPVDDMLAANGIAPRIGMIVQGFLPVFLSVSGTTMVGHVPERVARRYAADFGLAVAETPLSAELVEAAYWHPSKSTDRGLMWLVQVLQKVSEAVTTGDDPVLDKPPFTGTNRV